MDIKSVLLDDESCRRADPFGELFTDRAIRTVELLWALVARRVCGSRLCDQEASQFILCTYLDFIQAWHFFSEGIF